MDLPTRRAGTFQISLIDPQAFNKFLRHSVLTVTGRLSNFTKSGPAWNIFTLIEFPPIIVPFSAKA